jgi:hypothetical protein
MKYLEAVREVFEPADNAPAASEVGVLKELTNE